LEWSFPFDHFAFDLAASFGVFEHHMKFFDKPVEEAHRVLKVRGFFLARLCAGKIEIERFDCLLLWRWKNQG
jgi:hypothetical protein